MIYDLTFEDGSRRRLECALDYDRHTSVHMHRQLQTLSEMTFGDQKRIVSFAVFQRVRG